MNAKAEHFYLIHALIMVVVIGVVLALEHLLGTWLEDVYFRTLLIITIALALHFFLSSSLLEAYQKQEKNIQKMVDETLHELNTPIATINANVSLLQKAHQDEKSQKRLGRIFKASQNLSHLYENIERDIKSEVSQTNKSTFSLQSAIDTAIDKVQERRGTIMIENNTPDIMIHTDKIAFIRSLDNLLDNAIKYNKKSGFVHFDFQDSTLYIKDSGQGIDAKNLFIVFDKSYQENPSTQGFGLGLSIVKSYCDSAGIRVKIESQKEQGSTIMLDLQTIIIKLTIA